MTDTTVLVVQTIFVGALGAAIGSFLNVVVERTRAEQSFLRGRSKCPHCGRSLHWFEMVPLLSFVALGGACRTCRTRLSVQYLLLESVTATVFMTIWLVFGWTWETPLGWVVAAFMMLIAVYDGKWALVPDEFSLPLIFLGGAWAFLHGLSWSEIVIGGAAGGAFFGLQHLLSRGRWVGTGDIFLGMGLGLLLGWQQLATALILAYLVGACVAAVGIFLRKTKVGMSIAFGPYLMGAGFAAWLFGPAIVMWYLLNVTTF